MTKPERKADEALTCPCGDAISLHIGHKPCTFGSNPTAKKLWDLPIYRRMSRQESKS